MFNEYIDKLRSGGKRCFTSKEVMQNLSISNDAARAGLFRLKRKKKIISPLKGLYVVLPPEHQSYGSIPAEELIPIMMKYIDAEYYVGLLSAAGFYGASHQKPMFFQIVTNRRIKHSLKFGKVCIKLIYKKSLVSLPTKDFIVSSGYLKVARPELIAIDLLKFPKHSGGMNNIATVLSELIEEIDVQKLIELAERLGEHYQLQRLGYILEKIDVMNEEIKKVMIDILAEYVLSNIKYYTPLYSAISTIGHPRCRKWKIIENTDFESDL